MGRCFGEFNIHINKCIKLFNHSLRQRYDSKVDTYSKLENNRYRR